MLSTTYLLLRLTVSYSNLPFPDRQLPPLKIQAPDVHQRQSYLPGVTALGNANTVKLDQKMSTSHGKLLLKLEPPCRPAEDVHFYEPSHPPPSKGLLLAPSTATNNTPASRREAGVSMFVDPIRHSSRFLALSSAFSVSEELLDTVAQHRRHWDRMTLEQKLATLLEINPERPIYGLEDQPKPYVTTDKKKSKDQPETVGTTDDDQPGSSFKAGEYDERVNSGTGGKKNGKIQVNHINQKAAANAAHKETERERRDRQKLYTVMQNVRVSDKALKWAEQANLCVPGISQKAAEQNATSSTPSTTPPKKEVVLKAITIQYDLLMDAMISVQRKNVELAERLSRYETVPEVENTRQMYWATSAAADAVRPLKLWWFTEPRKAGAKHNMSNKRAEADVLQLPSHPRVLPATGTGSKTVGHISVSQLYLSPCGPKLPSFSKVVADSLSPQSFEPCTGRSHLHAVAAAAPALPSQGSSLCLLAAAVHSPTKDEEVVDCEQGSPKRRRTGVGDNDSTPTQDRWYYVSTSLPNSPALSSEGSGRLGSSSCSATGSFVVVK